VRQSAHVRAAGAGRLEPQGTEPLPGALASDLLQQLAEALLDGGLQQLAGPTGGDGEARRGRDHAPQRPHRVEVVAAQHEFGGPDPTDGAELARLPQRAVPAAVEHLEHEFVRDLRHPLSPVGRVPDDPRRLPARRSAGAPSSVGRLADVFIVSVCSLKGGVGKTSVTLGLASAALHQGVNTLVIDFDPQGDSTLGLLGEPASTLDIAEVGSSPRTETIDRAITPAPWAADAASHLDIIPGSSRSAIMDSPSQSAKDVRRLHQALEKRTHQYDLVLIDCPPSLNGLTQMALAASDRALVVAEPGFFA